MKIDHQKSKLTHFFPPQNPQKPKKKNGTKKNPTFVDVNTGWNHSMRTFLCNAIAKV